MYYCLLNLHNQHTSSNLWGHMEKKSYYFRKCRLTFFGNVRKSMYVSIYIYICFKTSFYVVRHLDSTASYLPTGLHLGFFLSWPSLYLPYSFSSVFLVLSFVSASTSMLFWVIFLLSSFEHGRTENVYDFKTFNRHLQLLH